jgi:hypothetical protein
VARDNNTTPAGRLFGVDAVLDAQTGRAHSIVKNRGVLVVADAAQVDDAVGRKDVLGAAGGILCSAASQQLGIVVGQEVLVEAHLGLLGQDGIVRLEVVLLEKVIVAEGLDVWCGEECLLVVLFLLTFFSCLPTFSNPGRQEDIP